MNEIFLGQKSKTEFLKYLRSLKSGYLYIGDTVPNIPFRKVFDPSVHSINVLDGIDARAAQELAVVLYDGIYRQGATTLTSRNGQADFAPALLAADRFDTIRSDSEEVMRIKDDILFLPVVRNAFCGSKKVYDFKTETRFIAHLDRSKIGDRAALTIGLALINLYKGPVVIDDLGFYGRDIHTTLVRENRLIARLERFKGLERKAPDLRDLIPTITKHIHGAIYPDAIELAQLAGLRPDPLREDSPYNTFIADCMR